ncbi:MAG: hypothetical protein OER88_13240, partial [Planctomycetota bacterium]|nr:hypothetical protein [Planctomycetota bacterium]
ASAAVLSWAAFRRTFGQYLPSSPSRFLSELPPDRVRERVPEASSFGLSERPAGTYASGGGSSAARAARAAARRRSAAPGPPVGQPGTSTDPCPEDGWAPGAIVKHPRFGTGEILTREGSGKHLKLTIRFASFGAKKILPAYTQLTREG